MKRYGSHNFGVQVFFDHGTPQAKGCAIFIKRRVKTEVHRIIKSNQGRYIILDITIDDTRYCLCNLYAPNEDDAQFFRNIFRQIDSLKCENIVIGGDFNVALTVNDIKSSKGKTEHAHKKSAEVIKEKMSTSNWLDIWRERNPDKRYFTWFKHKPFILMERLDYFLISANLSAQVAIVGIDPKFLSDHAILTITLYDPIADFGPGYWKLDIRLLDREDFLDQSREIILANCQEFSDPQLCWEMIKLDIRGLAIQLAARKKKSEMNKKEVLELKQIQLTNQLQKFGCYYFSS